MKKQNLDVEKLILVNPEYAEYIRKCWSDAETIAISLGLTDNNSICTIFDKITLHIHYWSKNKKSE